METFTLRAEKLMRPASVTESTILSYQKKRFPVIWPIWVNISTHVLRGDVSFRVSSSDLAAPQSSTLSTQPPGFM